MKYFLLILSLVTFPIFTSEKNFEVAIRNFTTGKIGSADSLKLIELSEGMKTVAETKNVQGHFVFSKIAVSDNAPILLQANFMGVNYNKLIPPENSEKTHEVIVYNSTKDFSSIDGKSLMQIVRTKDEIIINKIFLFSNVSNPPVSFFDPENSFEIFIPPTATEVYGRLTQNESKMGIPLSLPDGKNGKIIDRAIVPGMNELQISYSIPAKNLADVEFDDKLLFEQNKKGLVVFLKPKDIQLKIEGSKELQILEKDIPSGMKALRVIYPPVGKNVKYIVSGGTPLAPDDSKKDRIISNGKIFTTWQKSLAGVVFVCALLFAIQFIFTFLEKPKNEIFQNK